LQLQSSWRATGGASGFSPDLGARSTACPVVAYGCAGDTMAIRVLLRYARTHGLLAPGAEGPG